MMIASGLESAAVSQDVIETRTLFLTFIGHSQASMGVLARYDPVTVNPSVAVLVRGLDDLRLPNGDQLAAQALPEVQAILGRLEDRIDFGDVGYSIRNAVDVAPVETAVLDGWRGECVLPNDQWLDGVVRGQHLNVFRRSDLSQVNVALARAILRHFAVHRYDIADRQLGTDTTAVDIDGL